MKEKESDKGDLGKALWIAEACFTTDDVLPVQTLGHIQHTCETPSEIPSFAHSWEMSSQRTLIYAQLKPLCLQQRYRK